MKTQSKPIVALASSAVLVCGVLCQSAQAQAIIEGPAVAVLADVNGNNSGPTALPVTYEVTQFTSGPDIGLYDYSYVVSNPVGDPATVVDFALSFNAAATGAVVGPISGGIASENYGVNGVTWVQPTSSGSTSGTLSFLSDLAPVLGDANASGIGNPPGPWSSAPDGSQLPVPNAPAVPEPATTSLLAMALLAPAFGRRIFRERNFKKT